MDQWSPTEKDKAGASLYGATIRRVAAVGGKVRGILWYQGEAEANPERAEAFPAKFAALVEAFRKDLNAPDLPFYYINMNINIKINGLNNQNSNNILLTLI